VAAAALSSSDLRAALEVAVANKDDTPHAPLNLIFMSASALALLLPLALPLRALLLLAPLPPIEARPTPARNPLWAKAATLRMAIPFRPVSTSPPGIGVTARTLASVECHSSQCPLPQNHPPSNWFLLPPPGRSLLHAGRALNPRQKLRCYLLRRPWSFSTGRWSSTFLFAATYLATYIPLKALGNRPITRRTGEAAHLKPPSSARPRCGLPSLTI
jgi:hypothetical protein